MGDKFDIRLLRRRSGRGEATGGSTFLVEILASLREKARQQESVSVKRGASA